MNDVIADKLQFTNADLLTIAKRCHGVCALPARLEMWMHNLLVNHDLLTELIDRHGSPLHLHNLYPMRRNIDSLSSVASEHDLQFKLFYAFKANKCVEYAQFARESNIGIDCASTIELRQSLELGFTGQDLVVTAAIKTNDLLDEAIAGGAMIVIDNLDELKQLSRRLLHLFPSMDDKQERCCQWALRLTDFAEPESCYEAVKSSRFGTSIHSIHAIVDFLRSNEAFPSLRRSLTGLHFHLSGCEINQRILAAWRCVILVDELRSMDISIQSIDIGGGFPVRYLSEPTDWARFKRLAIAQYAEPVDAPERSKRFASRVFVDPSDALRLDTAYSYDNSMSVTDWFATLLNSFDSLTNDSNSLNFANAIKNRRIQLRCQPGRSLLDGCGLTAAPVMYRKQFDDGDWNVGLSMNHTNCRTSDADFFVDPILVLNPNGERSVPGLGQFFGNFCMEHDRISIRRFHFPSGIAVGDIVIFPNTAGYLMHFLESRGHQTSLPTNLFIDGNFKDFRTSIEMN